MDLSNVLFCFMDIFRFNYMELNSYYKDIILVFFRENLNKSSALALNSNILDFISN
jgi:hypothetical protein